MRAGDELELTLTALSPRGDGLADVDGRTVHVTGAFPGERIRARVDAVSRQHPRAFARLRELLAPHASRREPPCPRHASVDGACTGCPLMALDVEAQRAEKVTRARALGLPIDGRARGGAALGYRMSAKRVVGGEAGRVVLGSYRRGTHRLADMRGCLVDHPRITDAADAIADAASAIGVVPFDGESGDLRYVWLKTDGARVLATLITASDETRAEALAAALPASIAVAHSVQPSRGNALRGGAPRALRGAGSLTVTMAGVATEVGPLGFLQPNPAVAADAYRELTRDARGALALDLYAGAGVTTALLRERFDEVIPCESYPESAAALGVAPEEVAPFLERLRDRAVDLVVANPPRAGLGDAACEALVALGAPRLHVMSCDADTLARDLDALAGAYSVESLVAWDTLPQTPHLELVTRLRHAIAPPPR